MLVALSRAQTAKNMILPQSLECYPTQFIRADIDYERFFNTMNSNHLHTVYGNFKEVLRNFCEITGIGFICYNRL